MGKTGKLPKAQQEWIDQLIDRKSEIRRIEIRDIRFEKRRHKFATHHGYRVIFADGAIRSAFTTGEKEAVILTQANRITNEQDTPRNYLEVIHVCMTSWL